MSADFPTTDNAFQPTYGGGTNSPADGFVSQVHGDRRRSVYSSYLGGTDVDHINGLAIASDGDIIFSGRTRSNQAEGFPLVNAIDTTLAGNGRRLRRAARGERRQPGLLDLHRRHRRRALVL